MAFPASILVGGTCLLFLPRLLFHYRSRLRGRPPPGPPGLPLVGNIRDIPGSHEYPWLKYRDWCLEYNSDIIRLNALGSNIIVLDTFEAAKALLDERSVMYSGRPRMVMLNELVGFAWDFGVMDYGEDWRVCRKMAHHELQAAACKKYRPVLAQHAHEFVRRVTKESVTQVSGHLKHMTAANIMQVVYGIKVLPEQDPFTEIAEFTAEAFCKCVMDFHLVDVFPFLRYLPVWFPGAGFKQQAAVWHETTTRHLELPYADYMRREGLGKADDCMAKALAETYGNDKTTEHRTKMTTATMYLGGTDTVSTVLHTFFLAMLLYPDIQARARRELEAAIGVLRLPTFEDFGSVPYIDALIKELLRWQPVVPLAPPHKLREDDVYKGYHLEKDSLVIANIWSILHDDKVYSDPHTFAPDRFLNPDGTLNSDILSPEDAVFGFGRRACPGKFMTHDTLRIAIATILMCTEICLATDSAGREIEVKEEYSSSLVAKPRPFPCCVRFRSEAHAALLDHM